MARTAELELRPISDIFGVEVLGVDLRDELSEDVKEQLRRAWHRHALLAFRGQDLDEEALQRTTSIFGPISTQGEYSDRKYISNVDPLGLSPNGELLFHMDLSWSDDPLRGIVLYALEIPPSGTGGETRFANVKLAYESLPAALRAKVDKLSIVHAATMSPVQSIHPIAFPHPVTQETVLFCSPRHFSHVVGMSPEEGQALCHELEGYIKADALIYTHEWRPHDLIVWDNLKLQHARNDFDPKYPRHLRRLQIGAPS